VAVAESAPQADMRSVCVIRTRVVAYNISTDTERRAGLSAIAELYVVDKMPLLLLIENAERRSSEVFLLVLFSMEPRFGWVFWVPS